MTQSEPTPEPAPDRASVVRRAAPRGRGRGEPAAGRAGREAPTPTRPTGPRPRPGRRYRRAGRDPGRAGRAHRRPPAAAGGVPQLQAPGRPRPRAGPAERDVPRARADHRGPRHHRPGPGARRRSTRVSRPSPSSSSGRSTGLGLTKFGQVGDPFDPRIHEALSHIGEDPEVEVTTCKVVAKAGYRLGDRVVRAAQVLVVDPPSGRRPSTTWRPRSHRTRGIGGTTDEREVRVSTSEGGAGRLGRPRTSTPCSA